MDIKKLIQEKYEVLEQTEAVCIEAVKHNGDALQYVKPECQTEAVCIEAVKNNGDAIYYFSSKMEVVFMSKD